MKYTKELISKLRSPNTVLFPETEHEYLMIALDEIERLQAELKDRKNRKEDLRAIYNLSK